MRLELTLDDLFTDFILQCKRKNLSKSTINDYENKYKYFKHTIDGDTLCSEVNKRMIDNWILTINDKKDTTINSYIRSIKPFLYYGMDEGFIDRFKINTIAVRDRDNKIPYTENELRKLLTRPNIKLCTFAELRTWFACTLLATTGIRLSSLLDIRLSDVDVVNKILYVNKTKNRKKQVLPISDTLFASYTYYIRFRKGNDTDYLICTDRGNRMTCSGFQTALRKYCTKRGVDKHSAHLFRHTFAREWIINNGNLLKLQKQLGHSSLDMVRNYVAMYDNDLVGEENPIDKIMRKNERIRIK